MLRPKKQMYRKVVKQDPIMAKYDDAVDFYGANKKIIGTVLTVLVVAAIGAFAWFNNVKANDEKATALLSSVVGFFDNGQYAIAIEGVPERNIKGLKEIVDEYGNTDSGNLARFYLANAYFQTGKFEEALSHFEDFGASDPLLSVSRFAGIAGCYEALGKFGDAAEYFEKAATKYPKNVEAASLLHQSATNYSLAGKAEKAVDLFKLLKKDYPTTTFGRDADRYIAKLSL